MEWKRYEFHPSWNDYPLGPDTPDECPDGWTSHTWKLSVEQQQVSLVTDECAVCTKGINNGRLDDCLEMPPIEGTLAFDSDHGPEGEGLGGWHYDTRCDCNWWWTFTPLANPPGGDGS